MSEAELVKQLLEVRERGFEDSFLQFCADTFCSYVYPPENLAAARMHAHWLRVYLEDGLGGELPEPDGGLGAVSREVGEKALRLTLEKENASADEFCRAFVSIWCRHFSR